MVERYICPSCREVYKSKSNKCQKKGCNLIKKEYKHTWWGISMYITGVGGLIMLFTITLAPHAGIWLIGSFISFIFAITFNFIDDKKIDKIAQRDLGIKLGP